MTSLQETASATNLTDQTGYDAHYGSAAEGTSLGCDTKEEYINEFESRFVLPFHAGGWVFDGWAMQKVLDRIEDYRKRTGRSKEEIHILDAGCGLGLSSAYLASIGYRVTGIEISPEGAIRAEQLMHRLGLDNCSIKAANLSESGLDDDSVDIFFGRNTLHHFIKYPEVSVEFRRIAKAGAEGIFLDPFGENIFKNLFHNEEKMAELGDVLLTKQGIEAFFPQEQVALEPLNWFCLLDKLYIKTFGWKHKELIRKISKVHFKLDGWMPKRSRVMLWLAGTAVTNVTFR